MAGTDNAYAVHLVHLGTETQAARIFAKFGGVAKLVIALADIGHPRDRTTLYRWNHPKERGGAGGLVPSNAWPHVLLAARHYGILLTAEDTDPRRG